MKVTSIYILIIFLSYIAIAKNNNIKNVKNKIENSGISIDKVEAKSAFDYLNEIRKNPRLFNIELGVDLSYVPTKDKLIWNDTLARVAENKAKDMASKEYFNHIDPAGFGMNIKINDAGYKLEPAFYSKKSLNYFESLSAGSIDGRDCIKQLILDISLEPDINKGHRNHLLGIDYDNSNFRSSAKDIGIGFCKAKNRKYSSYISIIIAKHSF
ncbi:MAG: CAP domain-containing protein [Candidatus Kapabacteria bacterium]|nr:CAP domain-containing protein [Candidatus Kapabacteria bacterium]